MALLSPFTRAPGSPFSSRILTKAEGTHTSTPALQAVYEEAACHQQSQAALLVLLYMLYCTSWVHLSPLGGITTDAPPETKQGWFSSFLRHNPSSRHNQSSHQPSPSTFVVIASTTVVLQPELIMSINCPKGQLQ